METIAAQRAGTWLQQSFEGGFAAGAEPMEATLLHRVAAVVGPAAEDAAGCVVLAPSRALAAALEAAWATWRPQTAPRFLTAAAWAAVDGRPPEGAFDLRFEQAHDLLTAHALLDAAGLGNRRQLLAPRLLSRWPVTRASYSAKGTRVCGR